MTSIDGVQQIVAMIRAEMAMRVTQGVPRDRAVQIRSASKAKLGDTTKSHPHMRSLIAQRVKALDPDDPKRGKKAFRIFLESVLLIEFGESLINDPSFYQMIDDIQYMMEKDPQIAETISKAVALLLETKATKS